MKTLVICSGGLDSVTLAYKVASEYQLARLVAFDYGQRHKKELGFVQRAADALNVPLHIVDIASVGALLGGSALTDSIDVPDGHYAEENMKVTVVPNRNAIMLAIGFGAASAAGCEAVATAVHSGDHFIYPDCRSEFLHAFAHMEKLAMDGLDDIQLYTPFADKSKSKIVEEGAKYGVPFADTWSCYKGEEIHCGRCGTCVERIEAFHLAGVSDPTEYADGEYWREALRNGPV